LDDVPANFMHGGVVVVSTVGFTAETDAAAPTATPSTVIVPAGAAPALPLYLVSLLVAVVVVVSLVCVNSGKEECRLAWSSRISAANV
jgi:hypothetical protein